MNKQESRLHFKELLTKNIDKINSDLTKTYPKFYEPEYAEDVVISNEERDNFEILILKKSLEKNIPVLEECN